MIVWSVGGWRNRGYVAGESCAIAYDRDCCNVCTRSLARNVHALQSQQYGRMCEAQAIFCFPNLASMHILLHEPHDRRSIVLEC